MPADIIALARQYGRYGRRRITALLRDAGWLVHKKRVEQIYGREGLKVPCRQPKRGRLWLNEGSCILLRSEGPNHVWAYDFVDEFICEALAFLVARRLNSIDVIECLASATRKLSRNGALLSALSDAERLLLRTPLGPVYARLGS